MQRPTREIIPFKTGEGWSGMEREGQEARAPEVAKREKEERKEGGGEYQPGPWPWANGRKNVN